MPEISPKLTNELQALLEGHPPKRMCRVLRCLLMEYLVTNSELTQCNELPDFFTDLVYDLDALMNFLDVAEEEGVLQTRGSH